MPNLIGWDPFGELYSIRDTVNRMFGGQSWHPTVDILDRRGELLLRADLPGVDQKDIEVTVDEDSVVLKGEIRAESGEEGHNYFRRERASGVFLRVVPLSVAIKPDEARATFKNGVLEVTMPKADRAKQHSRTLNIENAQ